MTDAKPYTLEEIATIDRSIKVGLIGVHRARLAATVLALEEVTRERDAARAEADMHRGLREASAEAMKNSAKQRDAAHDALRLCVEAFQAVGPPSVAGDPDSVFRSRRLRADALAAAKKVLP